MKPIEAELHLTREKKDDNGDVVMENEIAVMETVVLKGILADIIVTRDNVNGTMEDNAYGLFFEETDNDFVVSLEQLSDIHVPNAKMRKYVSSHYDYR